MKGNSVRSVEEEQEVDVGTMPQHSQFRILVTEIEDSFRGVDCSRDAGGIVDGVAISEHRVERESVEEEF